MPARSDDPVPEDASVEESEPAAPTSTTCPNCGHTFRGNYCPNCGQKADRSVSIDDVAGSFLRELADVEGGLLHTFKALTLRPGDTLRAYLGGARARFIRPGRYLLVSILLAVGIFKGLIWVGALESVEDSYDTATLTSRIDTAAGSDAGTTFQAFMDTITQVSQSQWWNTTITLATVGLLALIFRRLFQDELEDWPAALATSAFLSGHAMVLWNLTLLLHATVFCAWTGQSLGLTSTSVYPVLITALYVGTAAYQFAPDWTNAVKGGLSALWVSAEAGGVGSLLVFGYLLLFVRPVSALSPEGVVFLSVMSGVYATPLLLHAAVETYYRLR